MFLFVDKMISACMLILHTACFEKLLLNVGSVYVTGQN